MTTKELLESNRAMQAELIDIKQKLAWQEQFLDSLEKLLEDMGFKLVKNG